MMGNPGTARIVARPERKVREPENPRQLEARASDPRFAAAPATGAADSLIVCERGRAVRGGAVLEGPVLGAMDVADEAPAAATTGAAAAARGEQSR